MADRDHLVHDATDTDKDPAAQITRFGRRIDNQANGPTRVQIRGSGAVRYTRLIAERDASMRHSQSLSMHSCNRHRTAVREGMSSMLNISGFTEICR